MNQPTDNSTKHFDEITCMLYLEGQLDAARSQELTQHTRECDACRTLVHALQHESLSLSSALLEQNELMPARLLSPAWNVRPIRAAKTPSWIWAVALGLFATGVILIWLDSINPWIDQLANAGFGAMDFLSMFLFNAPFWEGWSDMIDLVQIAVLVLAGGVAFQMVRRKIRRPAAIGMVMGAALFAFALPQPAAAAEVRRGQSIVIPQSETVQNDLIVAGNAVRMDGTVNGDLIVFAHSLVVTGHVTGDVIAFAGQVRLEGVVDGNVRVGSNTVTLSANTGKNVIALANTLDQSAKAQIGGGLIALAQNLTLDGTIHRDLLGLAGNTYLDGVVGGNVWLRGQSLAVTSTANIAGSTAFEGPEQPLVSPGAKLASPMHVEITQAVRRSRNATARRLFRRILGFVGAVVMSLILVTVFPGFFRATMLELNRIGLPIGVGALAMISGFFVTLIGIILIIVGSGAGIAAVLLYGPIFYISQIFVGAWLGNKILGDPIAVNGVIVGRIALGLLILDLVEIVPVIGGLVWFAVLMWGSGAVLMGFYRMSRGEAIPPMAA